VRKDRPWEIERVDCSVETKDVDWVEEKVSPQVGSRACSTAGHWVSRRAGRAAVWKAVKRVHAAAASTADCLAAETVRSSAA
jgi:hypothetical protein